MPLVTRYLNSGVKKRYCLLIACRVEILHNVNRHIYFKMINFICKNCGIESQKERQNNKAHCSNRCARLYANKLQTLRRIGLPKTINYIEGETWEKIKGYEGLYEISNYCRVKSCIKRGSRNEIEMKPQLNNGGYKVITLLKCDIKRQYFVHRLIAQAFIPNHENKPFINHINGIKTDNRIENLEWRTASENTQHAYDIGLEKKKIGELNGRCILKVSDVLEIKESIKHKHSLVELGLKYGVSSSAISNIKRGKTWGHIK